MKTSAKGFTLVELLIVIGFLAVLATATVLILNPAEFIAQSRDTKRIADLKSLDKALELYLANDGNAFGNSETIYTSLPDTNGGASADCNEHSLPDISPWIYNCEFSTDFKKINGDGWLPVPFSNIPTGSPISALPIDPVNSASNGQYYTYAKGSWLLSARLTSQKYNPQNSDDSGPNANRYETGSNLDTMPANIVAAFGNGEEGGGGPPPAPGTPEITTNLATDVLSASAVLNASVAPANNSVNVHFRWGETNASCSALPNATVSQNFSGNISQNHSQGITISPNISRHYFCAVAEYGTSTIYGSVLNFSDARLVGFWRFNESSGNAAADSSINANNGVASNHTTIQARWNVNNSGRIINSTNPRTSQSMLFNKDGTVNTSNNLVLTINKVGAPTGNATIRLSTTRDSGGVTATLDVSTLPTSTTTSTTLTMPNFSISAGTTYYLTVEYASGDASNYIEWRMSTTNQDFASSGARGTAFFGDTSQGSNDMWLTLTASSASWVAGYSGNAIEHDGRNSCVTVTNTAALTSLTGSKTFIARIKLDSLTGGDGSGNGLLHTYNTGAGNSAGYSLTISSTGKLQLNLGNGTIANETQASTDSIAANTWTFIAASYDSSSSTATFYVNNSASSKTFANYTTHGGGTLAKLASEDCGGSEWGLDGIIDEIRLYNQALSTTEINSIYNSTN